MTAKRAGAESFLSFARSAMETATAVSYPDKRPPIARQDAVYTWLKAHDDPLTAIWHLLSWCVVALEEHLAEEHLWEGGGAGPSEGEIDVVYRALWPGDEHPDRSRYYADRRKLVIKTIRALGEHRRGAWLRGGVGG